MRDLVDSLDGAIPLECRPAYAPELHPVGHIWAHLGQHQVGHFCATRIAPLSDFARQRRPTRVAAFWQQAELPPRDVTRSHEDQ